MGRGRVGALLIGLGVVALGVAAIAGALGPSEHDPELGGALGVLGLTLVAAGLYLVGCGPAVADNGAYPADGGRGGLWPATIPRRLTSGGGGW